MIYFQHVLLNSIKTFIDCLKNAYPDDNNLIVFDTFINKISCVSPAFKTLKNSFIEIDTKLSSKKSIIKLNDNLTLDIYKFIGDEGENLDIINQHLNNINNFIVLNVSKEEMFLSNFIEKFVDTIGTQTAPADSSNVMAVVDGFKPAIQSQIDQFKLNELDVNKFIKIICVRTKEYLSQNTIDHNIKIDVIEEVIDMIMETDSFEDIPLVIILTKLMSSGIFNILPLDQVTTLFTNLQN